MTAQRMKKDITSSRTSAKLGVGRNGDRVCPYSNAVRSNFDVHLRVTVA